MTRFIATALAILLAGSAQAQTATSNTHTAATSAASNQGVGQSMQLNSYADGTQTIKSAPQMGSLGLFGAFNSDSCMVSAGAGVSVIGFGVQGARPVRDEQCSIVVGARFLAQMSVKAAQTDPSRSAKLDQAAVDAMCNLNATISAALRQQGLCSQPATRQLATAQPTDSWGFSARIEP